MKYMPVLLLALLLSACSTSAPEEPIDRLHRVIALSSSVKTTDFFYDSIRFPLLHCRKVSCAGQGGFAANVNLPAGIVDTYGFEKETVLNGIDIVRTVHGDDDWRMLGGWTAHSGFFVHKFHPIDGSGNVVVFPQSIGRVSGSALPLEGTATYEGGMVGTHILTTDRYAGQSEMIAHFGEAPTIDIRFTNILNRTTGDGHPDISYEGAQISEGRGIWSHPSVGRVVNASFMGPDNEEVAGVFEHEDLIGAFGARRTE